MFTYNEIRAKWKDIEPKVIQGIKEGLYSNSYEGIVRNLAKLLLEESYSEERFTVIDWGDYQGTRIYIFAESCCQPSEIDTYIVSNYYGSCSGCDQLLGIVGYSFEQEPITDENTINDLLSLVRDIYERIRPLSDLQKIPSLAEQKDR